MIPHILGALPGSTEKKEERFIVILSDYGPAAAPLLIEALKEPATTEGVIKALVAMGPTAAPAVAAALTRAELRENLKIILKGYGAEGFRFYAPLARDASWAGDIEEVALSLDESINPELVTGLDSEETGALCARILRKRGSDAVKALVESLTRGKNGAPAIDILISIGADAVPPLFEQLKAEKGIVGSLLKTIKGIGRKETQSPVKKALMALTARYPGPLLEIADNPGHRDMALPLVAESLLSMLEMRELDTKAENISAIKNFIASHRLGKTMKKLLSSSKDYGDGTVREALTIVE